MITTKNDIRDWFERGVRIGATHLAVVCDNFDHDDYPVFLRQIPEGEHVEPFLSPKETHSVSDVIKTEYSGQNMQRCMEIYKLSDDMQAQLDQRICWNI